MPCPPWLARIASNDSSAERAVSFPLWGSKKDLSEDCLQSVYSLWLA
jgi:hypothetical protein